MNAPLRLHEIERLVQQLFSGRWMTAEQAVVRQDFSNPGVYILAFTRNSLAGKRIRADDVFYVGMSLSLGGVRQRLKQFFDGLEKNNFHSGAMRFFRDHASGRPFSKLATRKRFYASALTIPCDRESASDLRQRGHVACLEHYVLARVLARTGSRPALNKLL